MNFKHVLTFDFRIPKFASTSIVLVAPAILYVAIGASFPDIIGFVGSVALSLEALSIICIAVVARRKNPDIAKALPLSALIVTGAFFATGLVYYLIR